MMSLVFYLVISLFNFQAEHSIPQVSLDNAILKPYKVQILIEFGDAVIRYQNEIMQIKSGDTLSFTQPNIYIEFAWHDLRYSSTTLNLNKDKLSVFVLNLPVDKINAEKSNEIVANYKWDSKGVISTDEDTEIYLDDLFLGKKIAFLDQSFGFIKLKNKSKEFKFSLEDNNRAFLFFEFYLLSPKRETYQLFGIRPTNPILHVVYRWDYLFGL